MPRIFPSPHVSKHRPFPSLEYELLHELKPYLNYSPDARYPAGIGDDAVIRIGQKNEKLVFTADAQVEGTHFSFDLMTPAQVGYRAMMVNLSDLAAMGATPDSALVQLIFPRKASGVAAVIKEIYQGFSKACKEFGFSIVGGDLAGGNEFTLAITMIGRKSLALKEPTRRGAMAGDTLWVSGQPGLSSAGLAALKHAGSLKNAIGATCIKKHIVPVPRISLGQALCSGAEIHCLTDVSDGISKECHTFSYENKLGIILQEKKLVCSRVMIDLAEKLSANPLLWYLHGGEDYELLFGASAGFSREKRVTLTGIGCRNIGVFTKDVQGVWIEKKDGQVVPLKMASWDHLKHTRIP